MELVKAIKERRSVRRFKDEKVDRSILEDVISIAKYSPTWGHSQIIRYTVLDNDEMIKTLADTALFGFAHNTNITKSSVGVIVISTVKGKSGSFTGSQKDAAEWQMFDAGAASLAVQLAAHEKGVGTVVLGVFDQEKVAELIDLPSDEVVSTLIPYGYEIERPNTPPRKENEEILRFL
jgi:nitroreductase